MHTLLLLLLVVTVSLSRAAFGQGTPSSVATDSGLISHLKKTDPVLRQGLRDCTGEVVERTRRGTRTTFVLRATCQERVARSEAGDVNYRGEGRGTIDSPEWATVRSWRLDLQCH